VSLLLHVSTLSLHRPLRRHPIFVSPSLNTNIPRLHTSHDDVPSRSFQHRGRGRRRLLTRRRSAKHLPRYTPVLQEIRLPYRHRQSPLSSLVQSRTHGFTTQPYQADTDTNLIRGTQSGYNLCNSTTEGQTSLCQTSFLNAIDGAYPPTSPTFSSSHSNLPTFQISASGHQKTPTPSSPTQKARKSPGAQNQAAAPASSHPAPSKVSNL